MKKILLTFVMMGAAVLLGRAEEGVAKYDSRMALEKAVVTNGVKWIDGKYMPIEGRMYEDVDHYYDRLPMGMSTNINEGVRDMRHMTAGLQFRFRTNSKKVSFKWKPYYDWLQMWHMPSSGACGIDVYRFDEATGKWVYVNTGRVASFAEGGSLSVKWVPGEACLVNFPLYNGVKEMQVGIDEGASVEALGPRKSGVNKPVVFYGTSITHGGCASRPGMAFVNVVGRDLDVPVVNLGFSGSGKMEIELAPIIGRIDASCYVLDTLWNMNAGLVKERYENFIRALRSARPGVPIVMAEKYVVAAYRVKDKDLVEMNEFVRKLYAKLVTEGWEQLYYLPADGMYWDDEGTVDTVHPNDWGMMSLAKGFEGILQKALKLKR